MICEMSDKLRANLREVYKISYPWEGMGNACHPTGKRIIFSLFFQFFKSQDDTCNKLIDEMSDALRLSLWEEV